MSIGIEKILSEAISFEKIYEWTRASERYLQSLGVIDEEDYLRRGQVQEKISHCLERSAFQAVSQEQFQERMNQAREACEKAYAIYGNMSDGPGAPLAYRCRAVAKYIDHWVRPDPSEKRKLLDECLELEEKALDAFMNQGDKLEYARTYNALPWVFWNRASLEGHSQVLREILERGVSWGEKAVEAASELGGSYETARAEYILGRCMEWFRYFYEDLEREIEKSIKNARKAFELSEQVGDAYLIGLYNIVLSFWAYRFGEPPSNYLEKALICGEETRDNFLIARALDYLAYQNYWKSIGTEDPDQKRVLAKEAMEFYDKAHQHYSLISYKFPRGGKTGEPPPGGYADYYLDRADWETDPQKKLEYLEKSEKAVLKALKTAEEAEIPLSICRMSIIFSRTLVAKAKLEPELNLRRRLLEQALKLGEKGIEIFEQTRPFYHWNIGTYYNLIADIQAELAFIQPDLENKIKLLKDAVQSKEKGLNTINKIKLMEPNLFSSLYRYQDGYGTILLNLFDLEKDPDQLRKAIDVWQEAIESAKVLDHFSRIAESYWKIAKAQDSMREHIEASNNFRHASENYLKAAEKIPLLGGFYRDHASYMQAWREIELARNDHAEKNYGEAKEHYEKAAELHRASGQWSYLSSNYQAWAKVEEAEDLSRREQTQEARDCFQQAHTLFNEAQGSIEAKQKTVETGEERRIAEALFKASNTRSGYCLGRAALEEAIILDRQGDHSGSSKRYGQAVKMFRGAMDSLEREHDRREIHPIINLCEAWEKMMMAEARESSTMYGEASELFLVAKDNALDKTTSSLAQGHSSFCKALEAGTEFEITRDTNLFSEAKKHIEAATSHYLRAGHKSRSDYARATGRLLDAYLYTFNAQTETDPSKRAQFYKMAERLLQSSAGAYLKAKHPEKSDEIRRVLESVKEEREIAVSLSEVLHAPTIVSTTASFSTPTPTHEQAVGLERFENADIQANLITRRREIGVGDDLDIEIELVNAGKAPAQLIKVEDVVIDGFELKSYPDICRVEDSYLDMKGRTLLPLKTQELKLVLQPVSKGVFELKPRILYLDEAGKYKSHEPEPVSITVQELGIKGWFRGPIRQ